MEDDTEWISCLQEASEVGSPKQVRSLFALLLVFCCPQNIGELWNTFYVHLSEDFSADNASEQQILAQTSNAIDELLQNQGRSWNEFTGLPEWDIDLLPNNLADQNIPRVILEEINYSPERLQVHLSNRDRLYDQQKVIFDTVYDAVDNPTPDGQKLYFISGEGGAGKTFLYNTLCGKSMEIVVKTF